MDCPKSLSGEHVWQASPFELGPAQCKNCRASKPVSQYRIDAAGHIVPVKRRKPPKPKRKKKAAPVPEPVTNQPGLIDA